MADLVYLELRDWPQVGGFSARFVECFGATSIYSLASSYETIDSRRIRDGIVRSIKAYRHVATHGDLLYLYDYERQELGGKLGPYTLNTIGNDGTVSPAT